jgi:YD repeat-containing protein
MLGQMVTDLSRNTSMPSRLLELFCRMRLALFVFACTMALVPASAQSSGQADTVLPGWTSPSGPSGIFHSAEAACEAQWKKYQSDNESSRFLGAKTGDDDMARAYCEWTRYQYLCPEPGQPGGIGPCGTIIPSYVELTCPIDYLFSADGLCRLNGAREQPCGDACDDDGKPNPKTDNPIILSTGAKYLEALDYASADGLFRIVRQYRSYQVGRPIQQRVLPRSQLRGLQGSWNFEFAREIQLGIFSGTPAAPNATVAILMPDGVGYGFVLQPDGSWVESQSATFSGSSGNLKLEFVGTLPADLATVRDTSSVWRLTDKNDVVWTLQTRAGPNSAQYVIGTPNTMTTREGYSQTFSYASDGRLTSLSDVFGRTATFEWREFRITTLRPGASIPVPEPIAIEKILLPDGTSLEYRYEDVPPPDAVLAFSSWTGGARWKGGSSPGATRAYVTWIPKHQRLAGVERRSSSSAILDSVQYLYEDEIFGKNVTGIIDHRGKRVATYAYDSSGRVRTSELADGAEATEVAYSTSGPARVRTVTNVYGKQSEYTFSELSANNREYQLTAITSEATSATPETSTTLGYSGGTFLRNVTDAEGRLTTTTRDARGRPISITEASGTPDARTTTISWHATYNVPISIASPGLTETRAYDPQGRLTSVTLTDTTSHSVPYVSNGQSRTYTYGWDANGRLLSENGPLAAVGADDDVTTYTYDTSGNLLAATNPLGQVTAFSAYDANGRPGTITDANGVVTTFAYDLLGRVETITRKHPSTPALDAVTAMAYDEVGNLTQLSLPATQPLIMEYDAVNRMTAMRAANGER